jgi:molybdopterin converting factor small subunit
VATVVLPRSLVALFPGAERRYEVTGRSLSDVIAALDMTVPGLRERLVEAGPRLRPHINVFVDGTPADLATPVADGAIVHVIPAVSGGT